MSSRPDYVATKGFDSPLDITGLLGSTSYLKTFKSKFGPHPERSRTFISPGICKKGIVDLTVEGQLMGMEYLKV